MREEIEAQLNCSIRQWGEPEDDLGGELWSAVQAGHLIVADTLALLISSLQERQPQALFLHAA